MNPVIAVLAFGCMVLLALIVVRKRQLRRVGGMEGFQGAGAAGGGGGMVMGALGDMVNQQIAGVFQGKNPGGLPIQQQQLAKMIGAHARDFLANPNPKSCTASDWDQCPDSACCYAGKCRSSEICYGYNVNAKEEAKRDKKGFRRCSASGFDQCPETSCCFNGVCSEARLCYGDKPPVENKGLSQVIAEKLGPAPVTAPQFGATGTMDNGQGPCSRSDGNGQKSECRSGCCIGGVCRERKKCFG
jgi:hypothetical protein